MKPSTHQNHLDRNDEPRISPLPPTAQRRGAAEHGDTRRDAATRTCPAYIAASRVVKKLHPGQPGTKKLATRFGASMLCVRYRYDPLGIYRIKTVEVVIDTFPIHPRQFDRSSFGIELGRYEVELRTKLKLAGGRWEPMDRLWWVKGAVIRELRLVDRIRSR